LDSSASDIEIMQRVAKYDSKALEILYDRYSQILYTLIKKIVEEEKAAEDILTDLFVKIWEIAGQIDFHSNNVYAWLINFARNKAIAQVRYKRNPIETSEMIFENSIPKLSPKIKPMNLYDVFSMKDNIVSALNKLTEAQQYVIHLAYYEGLSEKEISKKLNIPLPTVKSKIKVALSNFKAHLNLGDS